MNIAKRIISGLICCIMVFSVGLTAFAADDSNRCPTIYVPGLDASRIYTDLDDTSSVVDTPDKDTLVEMMKNEIAPALVVYAADGDSDKLAYTITDALNATFADWFNNPDGTPKGNAGVINSYPAYIDKNAQLGFSYDWRGDPIVIAAQLDEYINYVVKTSGVDKVALTSHSMGSVIILTYLSIYGDDKIQGIVLDTPVIEGVTYVGDLLCGEAEFTSDALATYIKSVMGETDYQELAASTLDIFEMAGISEFISVFLDDVLKKIGPVLFRETLVPLFGCWLTIWAMAPEDRVEEAMDFVFKNTDDEAVTALKSKIISYNELVRKNRKDTLVSFDETGRLAIISRYGYSSLPFTASWEIVSDAVVDTKSSSLGATTAVAGDYFSDEYLADKYMDYISPDKTVDASTCLFPEKTWFIKNLIHTDTKTIRPVHAQLLFGEEEATCDNFSMPRFSIFDVEEQTVNPDNSVPQKAEKATPLERLFNFLKALFEKLISFFS